VNEKDLLELWSKARLHIIVSQLAPTFLLTITITIISLERGLVGSVAAKIAAAGILLASGILGSIAQYTSANEALAITTDLGAVENPSAVTKRIIATAWWTTIVKFVTPAIFVIIYLAILWALFSSPMMR
jgi:hypothetical protein